jgi:HTH-type transcriptional regulator/antitoxin HigA
MTYQPQPGELVPGWSIHPGELLKWVLAQRNPRQSEVAERAGVSAKHLNQLVKESIGITGDVAVRLERALGIPALFWTRAEAEYQAVESTRKSKEALGQYITWVYRFDQPTLMRNEIISVDDDDATKVDKTPTPTSRSSRNWWPTVVRSWLLLTPLAATLTLMDNL